MVNNECILTSGYKLGCLTIGGVQKLWLGTFDDAVTYNYGTDGIIETLDKNPNAITVYNFEQDAEYAGIDQPIQPSRENGTVFFETTLSTKFIELDNDLIKTIRQLSKAPVFAIVKGNNGLYYIIGTETAGRLSEGTSSLGVALGDLNGATLTFKWSSKDGLYPIAESLLNFSGDADATTITVEENA